MTHRIKEKSFVLAFGFVFFSLLAFSRPLSATVLHKRGPITPAQLSKKTIKTTTIEDRWSIKPPPYEINAKPKPLDPYNQSKLKGDFPAIGQNTFFIVTATSDTFAEFRKAPTGSGASAAGPGRFNFFGNGNQFQLAQNFKFSFELYKGLTAYKPRDWSIKLTPIFNINHLGVNERGVVNVDVRRGKTRTQFDAALEEAFVEKHLLNIGHRYDFVSIKGGIQPFTSDFRGLIYSDSALGGRLFGNLRNNKIQWNMSAFDRLEKDTNSDLNQFRRRQQQVVIGNVYFQDFFGRKGWTNQFSVHYNHDSRDTFYDKNGGLQRPDPAGAAQEHELDVIYAGWTSDGHIGKVNFSHAFYQVVGSDSLNPIAGRRTDINAQLAFAEVSVNRDWVKPRFSFLYASGDGNPRDDNARGFDSIFPLMKIAGAEGSFFQHQSIRLNSISLTSKNSFLPSLKSSGLHGQSNYVNPGLFLYNVGVDVKIAQKLKAVANVNYLRFAKTEPLELFLNQGNIRKDIGMDYGLTLQYRPFLNNNMLVNFNTAVFQPLGGFKDMLTSEVLYQTNLNMVMTY